MAEPGRGEAKQSASTRLVEIEERLDLAAERADLVLVQDDLLRHALELARLRVPVSHLRRV
jgi:hypothetical protein